MKICRKVEIFFTETSSLKRPVPPDMPHYGKWSLGLMPFGLKSFGLIQLVTWLNFLKLSVSVIGHLA